MTLTTSPHPIYLKAAANDYIDWADQAKLIRLALSRAFPGTKFYVRSDSFAGGASVDIYYDGVVRDDTGATMYVQVDYDGEPYEWSQPVRGQDIDYNAGTWRPVRKPGTPKLRDVRAVTDPFAGGNFDGMIDMAYSVRTWLRPDGSVAYGRSPGTYGSRGSHDGYDHERPEPGAVLIHFLAHYVFAHDELPYDVRVKNERS